MASKLLPAKTVCTEKTLEAEETWHSPTRGGLKGPVEEWGSRESLAGLVSAQESAAQVFMLRALFASFLLTGPRGVEGTHRAAWTSGVTEVTSRRFFTPHLCSAGILSPWPAWVALCACSDSRQDWGPV